ALLESLCDLRQLDDRMRDAQPLDGSAGCVAELELHVLDEAAVTEPAPHAEFLCLAQRGCLFEIEPATRLRDPAQRAMHAVALRAVIAGARRATIFTSLCVGATAVDRVTTPLERRLARSITK